MSEEYSKSNLNATLARWISAGPAVNRDCAACTKSLKCCDFQPFVPNFLLGGWLSHGNELPLIGTVHFTPIGAIPTPAYRASFLAGDKSACGFYLGGRCGLWSFRPGECSTYFCDSARPKERDSSFAVELAVAQMALVELGFSAPQISEQVDIVNGRCPGEYSGPELSLMYKKAWSWSESLNAETVRAWI